MKQHPRQTVHIPLALCLLLIIAASPALTRAAGTADVFPHSRDPLKWPFAQNSIWNMPIGSEARYVPANIVLSDDNHMTVDEDVIILTPDAPMTDVKYSSVAWNRNRSRWEPEGTNLYRVPIPAGFIYSSDTWDGVTPNACAAVLMPDGRTLHQFQPIARCYADKDATTTYKYDTVDLYGDGMYGAHGGSALSSIGGTIRLGELVPGGKIPHVMKMNLHARKNFYYAKDEADQKAGYRWPARKSDGSSPRSYQGTNAALQMGSLLALKPDFKVAALETEPGKILAEAFMNYGAYTVDSTGWDVYALCTEHSPAGKVIEEFKRVWGYDLDNHGTNSGWTRDYMKIIQALQVIDNNGPESVGGGGQPRQPLAPPFRGGAAQRGEAVAMVTHDLTPLQDTARVLANPNKGWYHHFPDNHPDKYKIARDADLLEFPGMDHLYIRLAWSYLEPKEGQFDWAVIDRIIEKWTAHGLGIAFRITCKETSTDRIEQQFATPRWVMEAGAKGGYYRFGKEVGPDGPWEPVFDDPVFLSKLDNFLAAFAARYDQQPWVRYVDIGSIGDWGEGHLWAGSRKEYGFAARKQHVDLYLKHFKQAPLVANDDFVYALSNPAEREAMNEYILANGISYRDDSILVNSYIEETNYAFTVRSPKFFADAYRRTPTVLELEHYGNVKKLGNWTGLPDSALARFGAGKTGPDYFRGAIELEHSTYLGYHGDARQWLTDNPELTRELLNRCGYWLFPKSIGLPQTLVVGTTVRLTLVMENRGVAPAYAPYELRVKLSGAGGRVVRTLATGCKSWLPGKSVASSYELPLPPDLKPGDYALAIGLFDLGTGKERPVDFALKASAREADGYYELAKVSVTAGKPSSTDRRGGE